MYFRIPELGNPAIAADPALRPILIVASNSEKNLPDPFLRRCVYYNIPFPDRSRLADIIISRLAAFRDPGSPLLNEGIEFFEGLRGRHLHKPPSTAELINWLHAMVRSGAQADQPLRKCQLIAERTLSALAKAERDVEDAKLFATEFFKKAP